MRNIRRLIRYYFLEPRIRRRFTVSQVLLALGVFFELLLPLFIQRIVDDGITPGNLEVVFDNALAMVVAAMLATIFAVGTAWYAANFAEGAAHNLRQLLYGKIQQLSFGNLDRFQTSDLLVRLTTDINATKLVIQNGTMIFMRLPFMSLGALALILVTSAELVWIVVVIVPVLLVILVIYQLIAPRLYQAFLKRLDALNLILQENLSGVRVVKAFVRERYEMERYGATNDDLRKAARSAQQSSVMLLPSLVLVINISTMMVLWFGGNLAIDGVLSVGQIIAFTNYVLLLMIPLVQVSFLLPQVATAESSLDRIGDVFEDQPDVQDKPDARPLTNPQGRVVFENVSFSYLDANLQPTQPPVLKNVSFTAEPGEMVAILGATGSGKSSLVNLIPRFYDVTEGRITIDGVDVRDYTRASLLAHITPVLQQAVLFSGTVRGNIKFGAPGMDDARMLAAAQAADAHGFISTRADDYDAEVKQRGTNFSGGQKQRISIARAVARKPAILILDDSTSALDVATETRVQAALAEMMQGTTTFVVAQRISTVLIADKILVLDNGEIVAQGTHADLLANSPVYQEIYRSQLGDPEEKTNGSN